jgi:phosphonate transport system substrate-binding protein
MSPDLPRPFLFALPPSLGAALSQAAGPLLKGHLSAALNRPVEVEVSASYEALAKMILSGRADAAWAPPFVCARVEAMGVRVLARGVRDNASSYRAALLCRSAAKLSVDALAGTTAAWVDRDSTGGYLLALAHLRGCGLNPAKLFSAQHFLGSYRAALEAVLDGKADVTSLFAPPEGDESRNIEEVCPGRSKDLRAFAFTDAVPNDGVVVSMSVLPDTAAALGKMLLSLHESGEGRSVLEQGFHVERFEPAPRLGYRALYRVAMASL